MKISELIRELTMLQDAVGDVEVATVSHDHSFLPVCMIYGEMALLERGKYEEADEDDANVTVAVLE